jgi:hypothetical protein
MFGARFLLGLARLNLLVLVCLYRVAALNSHVADLLALLHPRVDLHLLELLLALDVYAQLVAYRLYAGALAHVHAQLGLLDLAASLLRLLVVHVLLGTLLVLLVRAIIGFLYKFKSNDERYN